MLLQCENKAKSTKKAPVCTCMRREGQKHASRRRNVKEGDHNFRHSDRQRRKETKRCGGRKERNSLGKSSVLLLYQHLNPEP
jgi:hypothetical protein